MEIGLYIHIPFCQKRCNYCDFYTIGNHTNVSDIYIKAVLREIKKYKPFVCKTVYFGGGTPSLLSPQQVQTILSSLEIKQNAEITLEANPETLSQEKLNGYFSVGVNRLSIGVQTSNDNSLKSLGRIHDKEKAVQVFDMAKKAGFKNISGDIMLGLDNYTLQELEQTISLIEQGRAVHISAYMLKIEPNTPFYKNRPQNLSTEEQLSDFYLYTCDRLKELGYEQYEISNFAKPNFHSRHNTIYWELGDYLGIGPSAHSCIDGKRFYYENSLETFVDDDPRTVRDGNVTIDDFIMLSLRLKQGLNIDVLKGKWGKTLTDTQMLKLNRLKENGFIKIDKNIISLTPKGFLVENSVACEIML